jgi:hypothetical protein
VHVRTPVVPVGIIIKVRRISGVAARESKTDSPRCGNQDGGLSVGTLCGYNRQSTYRHCNEEKFFHKFLFVVLRGDEASCQQFPRRVEPVSSLTRSDARGRAVAGCTNADSRKTALESNVSIDSKKKSWLEIVSEPAQRSLSLRQLSIDDDNGGAGNSGARRTRKADNSHSTDTFGNTCTGNSHIRCNSHTADNHQPRFRLTPEHQNVARGRKPIHLPSMRLREVSS